MPLDCPSAEAGCAGVPARLRSRSLARKERQAQSEAEIDAIVDAIRSRDVDAAKRAAAAHVNSAMDSAFSVLGDEAPGEAEPAPARRRRRTVAAS